MFKKSTIRFIILSSICFLGATSGFAESVQSSLSGIVTIDTNKKESAASEKLIDLTQVEKNFKTINLTQSDDGYNITNATDKFIQCNIRASWEDFKNLLTTMPDNDFMYISFANKMADLGLFDLANRACIKIRDKDLSSISIDAMKRFYYPSRKMKLEDELFLAEIYSNITFNNQSSEATNELLTKDSLLSNYDYANYLVALGSFKSNSLPQAAKYINLATLQNPSNLNYQKLKAEIYAENNKPEEALKIVANLKKQNLISYEYEKKVKSLEQFILYKISKSPWEKDYHLGYYYYLENNPSKAIRALESALSTKKKANICQIYGLMSEIYLSMNEFEKASDKAKKAHKINSNNTKALITLGDLNYIDKNYKQALNYYKQAASEDKKSYVPLVKEAQTYQKLVNIKKADELYTKILKNRSDSWEAYYNVALLNDNKRTIYLKKALAVNPLFEDGWIELAKTEIANANYNIAQKYLANAFYIDENDFRYYYYQGLIDNDLGNYLQAKYNFKKSLKLKPDYKEAKSALDAIINIENGTVKQDNI